MSLTEPSSASFSADLPRRKLGGLAVVAVVISASAPLTVAAGGTPAAFAASGMVGLPWVYLGVGGLILLFSIGYGAMSRHVVTGGGMFTYVARGLGPRAGVAAAFVAVLAYSAIQVSVYGFLGAMASEQLALLGLPEFPWVIPAAAVAFVVLVCGVSRIEINARLLGGLLVVECLLVAGFVFGAALTPAQPESMLLALSPDAVATGSFTAALCLCVAAYTGVESAGLYAAECREPSRTVAKATYIAIAAITLGYSLIAWSMTAATGPGQVVTQAQKLGSSFLFTVGSQLLGPWFGQVGPLIYLSSMFAALLAFATMVARYLFALGRERVLWTALGRQHSETGAPVVGAFVQFVISLGVVILFWAADLHPVQHLAVWTSGLGALGILLLMAMTSIAVISYFRHRNTTVSRWSRSIAPALSAGVLSALTLLVLLNFDIILGSSTPLWWIPPAAVIAAGLGGLGWASWLQRHRPEIYDQIGNGGRHHSEGPTGFLTH
ncbi:MULTISPECIES: APC family permease [unclassified Crossiella]|uniref:APC family permease n=1 Tax=unclassified Crossiella TaxID=2620835 RepID=UPI002000144E|nr:MULTISPECIES: APC family permease [unclassified Crossiella]MCK2245220.1 APC family permease [Crossiella sp. S99.2]MCK2258858.1 APC family permease [Crossiella sp. S99.1]